MDAEIAVQLAPAQPAILDILSAATRNAVSSFAPKGTT